MRVSFIQVFGFVGVLLSAQAGAFPWYAGGDNIRGAQLLTPVERKAHVTRLQSMPDLATCQAYMREHIAEVDRRAQEQHVTLPPVQGDPCEVMRAMGRIR